MIYIFISALNLYLSVLLYSHTLILRFIATVEY